MGQNIYNVGLSALLSYQQALTTTSNNVTNVNTPGYSRQMTNFTSTPSVLVGGQYYGTGVKIASTSRMYNELLAGQVRNNNSAYNQYTALATYAGNLDNFLWGGDPSSGSSSASIITAMDSFFSSMQKVIQVPDSSPARQSLLTQAHTMTSFINNAAAEITSQADMAKNQIASSIQNINTITENIALLNKQIAAKSEQNPNGLLDQRDNLIDQLSELVKINTIYQDDGTVDISLNGGTPLVMKGLSMKLASGPDPENPQNIAVFSILGTVKQQLPGASLGGSIGGLFEFQDNVVSRSRNMLGAMVIGFSSHFNAQHQLGVDANGKLGGLFFNDLTSGSIITNKNNIGTAQGSYHISNVDQLSYSDYKVSYEGGWMVTRVSDNTVMGPFFTNSFTIPGDGVEVNFTGVPQLGDSFLIQPTANAASQMHVLINDPSLIAMGTPIIVNINPNNTGSATFDQGVVTDVSGPNFTTNPGNLTPPILIEFTSLTTYSILDNTNPAAPVPILTGLPFVPGQNNAMIPASLNYGYQVTIGSNPNINDRFTIDYNSNGGGDSRNAQLLADLQNKKLSNEGTSNFQDIFNSLVGVVGNIAGTALAQQTANQTILESSQQNLSSLAGVNLDEEASNLLIYKQGYEAAAQIISVASTLFNTIMQAVQG